MKGGDKSGIFWFMVKGFVKLSDLLGKYGCNNMVWVTITNQDKSNSVQLGLKSGA